ncbi:MAG: helix-turn-helix transcriptional regulator, partial [Nitriliruptor sp.]
MEVWLVVALDRQGSTAVAATKLRPPSVPRTLVQRDHLVQAFTDEPLPVTLVCGPAGAGKTTLLTSWIAARHGSELPVVWLDLDGHDDDAFLLWNALLAAFRSSGVFTEDDRIHAMQPPRGGADGAFLAELMDAVGHLEQPLWLVLDDVHELTDPDALASLDLMLRRLPTSLRVVLSSRADPPLGLQRLRLAGALREIRIGDLAFTRDEAAELLERHAVTIEEQVADELLLRTEGWAAGLQIAALALVDDPDPHGFMHRFNGNDRSVADYLVEEILGRQTAETRRFLLETSTCTRIAIDLAEHLTGRHDVGQVLDGLVRENSLTVLVGER